MFGKIKYIDDITAVVEIHKENMVVPNLMNLHVIFETKEQKLLGEVKKADEDTVHIDLMGQFVGERFIAGTIKKPTLDSNIRIINDDELNIILGSNKQGNLYLGKSVSYSETGTSNFGYRDISFSLALSVVKCQQMFSLAWFRSVSHAASSRRSSSMSAILRERHCRVMTLSSISAMFSQLPCFGV